MMTMIACVQKFHAVTTIVFVGVVMAKIVTK